MTHVNSVARGVTASEVNPYQRLPILRGGQRTVFKLCRRRLRAQPSDNTALISVSISLMVCAFSVGQRCATRLGTANSPALTVRSTPDHAASTSAASTNSPRSFAALISATSACAAASRPRSASRFR